MPRKGERTSTKDDAVRAYNRAHGVKNPCRCGCGELANLNYVNGHNTRLLTQDEQTRRGLHNDGSKKRDTGTANWYRVVGGRHEHRTVAEETLGRPLQPGEIVHHKNNNKKDNRPENLEVMTQSEHARMHFAEARRLRLEEESS